MAILAEDQTAAADKASRPQAPLIALVGSANSGKTTLFNLLTGSHYQTANYPGATVEYALGKARFPGGKPCLVMDTPGLSSLLPASADERVTVRSLFEPGASGVPSLRPHLVICVVDATQLSRHLYLARQLQDCGFPIVIALTMNDVLRGRHLRADPGRLSELMDCPVHALDPRSRAQAAGLWEILERHCPAAPAAPREYREFAAALDEERIAAYYRALDEVEGMVVRPLAQGPAPAGRNPDRILLHPVFGLAIFLLAMCAIFTAIFWLAAPFMDAIDGSFARAIAFLHGHLPEGWFTDLLADGLVGGVGAVAVFLPQILILFTAMGYLEDSGYLARGAALVDRPLSAVGLNGKSFVPLLSGYACAIPAILSARTIPNRIERLLTIFIIPLMSCSARLPVYALLLAFLVPHDKPWLGGAALTGLYVSGLVMGAAVSTAVSRILRKWRPELAQASGFVLELPELRRPVFKVVFSSTYHKTRQYAQKAGLTIVLISLGLWVLSHTPPPPQDLPPAPAAVAAPVPAAPADPAPAQARSLAPAPDAAGADRAYVTVARSYAGTLGHWLAPVMRPMGLDWKAGVAMICGVAAREVFVSSLALMYRIEDQDKDSPGLTDKLLARMREARFEDGGGRVFTTSSCLGIVLFFMIAMQCLSTAAVARQETGGWLVPLAQILVYTGGAYGLAVALVQGLRALGVS